MKRLAILFVVFMSFAMASAQKITQDTLMGNWSLRKMQMRGCVADLKTGEVTISDEFAAEKGQTKEALARQFKERIINTQGSLNVLQGGRLQYKIGPADVVEGSFVITTDKEGRQFLTDEYNGTKIEAYFKEGLLYWELITNTGNAVFAWQRDAE